jgi:hypothetical protein
MLYRQFPTYQAVVVVLLTLFIGGLGCFTTTFHKGCDPKDPTLSEHSKKYCHLHERWCDHRLGLWRHLPLQPHLCGCSLLHVPTHHLHSKAEAP